MQLAKVILTRIKTHRTNSATIQEMERKRNNLNRLSKRLEDSLVAENNNNMLTINQCKVQIKLQINHQLILKNLPTIWEVPSKC